MMTMDSIYLTKPKTKITIEQGEEQNMIFTCASMQGWRRTMEDSIIREKLNNGDYLFGVLDGHGGPEVAQVVSQQLPRFLESNKYFKEQNFEEAFKDTFQEIDKWLITSIGLNKLVEARFGMNVLEIISNIKSHRKSFINILPNVAEISKLAPKKIIELIGQNVIDECGCTANIILIHDKKTIYCANIGDSRSVGIFKGKSVIMSFDHKPSDVKERARIRQAGGFVMDDRVCGALSLSRAFGDYQFKDDMVIAEPDVRKYQDPQMIFIACDGIWEGLHDYGQSLTQKIFKNKTISQEDKLKNVMNDILAQEMTDETIWGLDNMSCILIDFKTETQKKVKGINKTIKKNKQ